MNRELNDWKLKIWTCEEKYSGKTFVMKIIYVWPGSDKDLPLGQNKSHCVTSKPGDTDNTETFFNLN